MWLISRGQLIKLPPSEGQLAEWYAENEGPDVELDYLHLPGWHGLSTRLQKKGIRLALAAAAGSVDWQAWGALARVVEQAIRQISRKYWRDNRSAEQKRRDEEEQRIRRSSILLGGVPLSRGKIYEIRGGRCEKCSRPVSLDKFHLHHLEWLSRGGKHTFENIQILCLRCHHRMHHPSDR